MNTRFRPAFAAILAATLTLILASCSKEADIASAAATDNSLLAYVPENTPYMAGNLEPVPEEVISAMFARMQPGLDAVQVELEEARDSLDEDDSADEEGRAIALAVLNELDGKLNPEGLKSLGFSMEPYQAVYGMGMFPVFRVSLENAQALRDTIARIESNSGMEFPVKESQGQSYWRLGEDNVDSQGDFEGGVYLAIVEKGDDSHLAFSVFPTQFESELLPAFLGQVMPESSSAAMRLAEINTRYGYTTFGSGYMDFQRVFDELTDPDSLFQRSVNQDGSEDFADLDAVCQAEIRALIDRAPRMVAGATEMSTSAIGGQYRLELADDLANDLAALVANVPSAPGNTGRLLEFAVGIRIGAARDFLIRKLTDMTLDPFECEQLANMNTWAADTLERLNYPMPPLINNILGVRASLDSMPEDQADISAARGTVALYMDKPEMVLGMAQMFLPQMEEIEIEKGGPPVELPESMLPMPGVTAYAAMSDSALGIALGEDEQAGLREYLAAESEGTGSFFSVNYDLASYMDSMDSLTDELIAAGAMNPGLDAEGNYPHDSEVEKAFEEAFKNMAGRNQMEFRFDEHGFAVDSLMQFRD